MKTMRYLFLLPVALMMGACGQEFEVEQPAPVLAIGSFVDNSGVNTLRLGRSVSLTAEWNFNTSGNYVVWRTSNNNIEVGTDSYYGGYADQGKHISLKGKSVGTSTLMASLDGYTAQKDITVLHIADFDVSQNGLAVTFTPVAYSSDYSSFEWDFGEGSPHSTYFNVRHTYSAPGTYTVSLTLNNKYSYGTDKVTKTIYVTY